MIIGTSIINRESYVNFRVPESLKLQFYDLAKSKGKSASTYMLELSTSTPSGSMRCVSLRNSAGKTLRLTVGTYQGTKGVERFTHVRGLVVQIVPAGPLKHLVAVGSALGSANPDKSSGYR